MTITVNGERRQVGDGALLAGLLAQHGVPPEGSAVALNDHVVARARVADIVLRDGDRVEIIVAVAGG